MRSQRIDFVQLTCNPLDREAEQRLLPLAQKRGTAAHANRPLCGGALLQQLQRHARENMAAATGRLPDEALRQRTAQHIAKR